MFRITHCLCLAIRSIHIARFSAGRLPTAVDERLGPFEYGDEPESMTAPILRCVSVSSPSRARI